MAQATTGGERPRAVVSLLVIALVIFTLGCVLDTLKPSSAGGFVSQPSTNIVHRRALASNASAANVVNILRENEPDNKISFIYVVGVEGVGHHGITPAIATIGKTCNQHVVYKSNGLWDSQIHSEAEVYKNILHIMKRTKFNSSNVLVVEDGSFPNDKTMRVSTPDEKKSQGKYDLEWVFDQVEEVGGIDLRFILLNRNFYRAISSHVKFDKTFQKHAQVLVDYSWYIHQEYTRIDIKKENIWRQVSYEWFTNMTNCTALVSAVIHFAQWDNCDVEFACKMLAETVRKERPKHIDAADWNFTQTLDVDLPLPHLDISDQIEYNFTHVVSDRKPFSFLLNMTEHARAAKLRLAKRRSAAMNGTIYRRPSNITLSYRNYNNRMKLEAQGAALPASTLAPPSAFPNAALPNVNSPGYVPNSAAEYMEKVKLLKLQPASARHHYSGYTNASGKKTGGSAGSPLLPKESRPDEADAPISQIQQAQLQAQQLRQAKNYAAQSALLNTGAQINSISVSNGPLTNSLRARSQAVLRVNRPNSDSPSGSTGGATGGATGGVAGGAGGVGAGQQQYVPKLQEPLVIGPLQPVTQETPVLPTPHTPAAKLNKRAPPVVKDDSFQAMMKRADEAEEKDFELPD